MIWALNYLWRLAATGIAFAAIFFGGGVLAVTVLRLIALFPGHQRARSQRVIRALFRCYITLLQRLGVMDLKTTDIDQLDAPGGRLVIANHPSLLDVVLLMAFTPRAQCIVKHQLWSHRFLGPLMRGAGYIRNDLPAEDMLRACQDAIAQGSALIIFPEGTRSTPGVPIRLHRGFANLATLTGADVQPVCITCQPPTLIKGEPWWRIPPRKPLFTLEVGARLDAAAYACYPRRSVAARRLVRTVEAYFAERLGRA